MFMDTPETLIYVASGALLLGWSVGKIGAYFGNKFTAGRQNTRDSRIRSLQADKRVARTQVDITQASLDIKSIALADSKELVETRDSVINEHLATISRLRSKLKASVNKTNELRAELSNRATEGLKSEKKLRDVETELSVAHASAEMINSGVLDYTVSPNAEAEQDKVTSGKLKNVK